MEKNESKVKRLEHAADAYEQKGKREWAYAKNGKGGEHFAKARQAFNRAAELRDVADKWKK